MVAGTGEMRLTFKAQLQRQKSSRYLPIKRAFTLIELLVVMAIIAILAALLLPALARAKARGQTAACLNNLKQLATCVHLYSTENNDHLPPNNSLAFINNSTNDVDDLNAVNGASWCANIAPFDPSPEGIETGVLFPYNRSMAIYRCPADKSTVQDRITGAPLPQPRVRSYNMSLSINGYPEYDASSWVIPSYKKFTAIRKMTTSQLMVFIDVHEKSIYDTTFGIPNDTFWPNVYQWWDLPADRHNQGCNLSFADGHVEHWRWKVKKIYSPVVKWGVVAVRDEEREDFRRVKSVVRQTFE
jgi:prepilin-type N-terminal cleavage/methylation domain-containing protein/prepilin-type processing-associated H-X9-DG protein